MMTYRRRTWGMCISIVGLCYILSGCNFISTSTSPEEQFQISVSGLAGTEALTFMGEAALRRNEQRQFEQHFAYEGKLTNHDQLTMQSILPVQSASKKKNMTSAQEKVNKSADFLHMNGEWVHTSSKTDQADQVLIRFNPLDQLEEISGYGKVITEERGASRGTRVLRIELKPEDALEWLDKQLSSEMNALRQELVEQRTLYSSKVRSELDGIWKKGDEQLQAMLKEAKVGTIYHMTIDRTSNLPIRLTSESNMSYLDLEGIEQIESVVNDVSFQL